MTSQPDDFSGLFLPADPDTPTGEDLTEGGTWLLDLISAVDFMARGDRHGLTVWDALEEALRWWLAEKVSMVAGVIDPELADLSWSDPDPLKTVLTNVTTMLEVTGAGDTASALQQAVRHWSESMSRLYNDGRPWPHPLVRRAFPIPELDVVVDGEGPAHDEPPSRL